MSRNNNDFTKDTTDKLIVKSKHKLQKETYKMAHNTFNDLKDKRKIKVHRNHLKEIQKFDNEINNYAEKYKINNTTKNYTFKNNKSDIQDTIINNQTKINSLDTQRQILLNERQKYLNRNHMLRSSLNYLDQKSNLNNKDFSNKQNINFQEQKNEEFTKKSTKNVFQNEATKNVFFEEDRKVHLFSDSKTNKKDKFFTSEKQKKINQKRMMKTKEKELKNQSFLNNPLTSKSVGERNLVQKTIMTPVKFTNSIGASYKESINRDIEESEMAGIQLANDIVSPLASKLKFETENMIARKIGFDRKANNLYKLEKKIIKADKKAYKVKKAQRKRIRKEALLNEKSVLGNKKNLSKKFKEGSKHIKNKIANSLKSLADSLKSRKTIAVLTSLIIAVIIPTMFVYPMLAISGSGISLLTDDTSDYEIEFIEYEGEYDLLGGKLVYPVPNHTPNSSYGWRFHPIDKVNKFHTGTDIPANTGTTVIASGDGKVIHSGDKGGYGKTIMIDHGNGVITLYAHNSKLSVKVGTTVKAGQKISEVGSTGKSTGPHLHFEVRVNGKYTDPLKWVSQ